jgi:hypothetical protein
MSRCLSTPSGDEATLIMPAINLSSLKVWSDSSQKYFNVDSLDELTLSYTASDGSREKVVNFQNILFEGQDTANNEPYYPIVLEGNTFNLYRFHPGVVKRCLAKNMPLTDAITAYYQKNPSEARMYPQEFISTNKKFVKQIEKMCASA